MTSSSIEFLILTSLSTLLAADLHCESYSWGVPTIPSESIGELTGQVMVACFFGTALPAETIVPTIDVTVSLNAPLVRGSEALLIVNEVAPGQQHPCTAPPCAGRSSGNTTVPFGPGPNENKSVYAGIVTASNTVKFTGVPFWATGVASPLSFRVANLRTDVKDIPSMGLMPGLVIATVVLVGPGASRLSDNFEVARVAPGLFVSPGMLNYSGFTSTLSFSSSMNGQFRRRNLGTTPDSPNPRSRAG